jgi:hypothetical protein
MTPHPVLPLRNRRHLPKAESKKYLEIAAPLEEREIRPHYFDGTPVSRVVQAVLLPAFTSVTVDACFRTICCLPWRFGHYSFSGLSYD